MDHPKDLTPTERGAVILERLRDGRRMTTATIARELGVSRQWAHYMIEYRIARTIPRVARDEKTGEYFYCDEL